MPNTSQVANLPSLAPSLLYPNPQSLSTPTSPTTPPTHQLPTMQTPPTLLNSDSDTCSLTSSVCNDYYNNLLQAGLDMVPPDQNDPLNLAASPPSPSPSPPLHSALPTPPPLHPLPPSTQPPDRTPNPTILPAAPPAPTAPTPDSTPPTPASPSNRHPSSASPMPRHDKVVETSFSALALSPGDSCSSHRRVSHRVSSSVSPCVRGPSVPSSPPSGGGLEPLAVRRPGMADAARETWDLIERETIAAFRYFHTHPVKGSSYTCQPMGSPKVRLAMHRAAEVLGCRSSACGNGAERRVVLSWTKNGTFPIGERAVVAAVRGVLAELFPRKEVVKGGSSRTQKKGMRQRQRSMRRRERRLENEAKVADLAVDGEVVEELMAEMDWRALDQLYQGLHVPGIERKKRQAKQRGRAMQGRGMNAEGAYGGMGRYGGGEEGHGMEFPSMYAGNGMFVGYPGDGFGKKHEGMAGVGALGRGRGMHGRWDMNELSGGERGYVESGSSTGGGSKGGQGALNARPLEKDNKGFAMLEKMGWKKGDGLGSEREGRREPVIAEVRRHRAGLGG